VQEVTNLEILNIMGYLTHLNVGTTMRGTAILARSELHLSIINTLHSGQAIAAKYNGMRLIKEYAPSGTARRTERENLLTRNCHIYSMPFPNTCLLEVTSIV